MFSSVEWCGTEGNQSLWPSLIRRPRNMCRADVAHLKIYWLVNLWTSGRYGISAIPLHTKTCHNLPFATEGNDMTWVTIHETNVKVLLPDIRVLTVNAFSILELHSVLGMPGSRHMSYIYNVRHRKYVFALETYLCTNHWNRNFQIKYYVRLG